jgi:chromosomal replication initiator protein
MIRPTGLCDDRAELSLEVPNEFHEVWLKDNYMDLLEDAVSIAAENTLQIHIISKGGNRRKSLGTKPAQSERNGELVEKKPRTTMDPPRRSPLFNAKCRFSEFVVGSNNTFAHAAALAVAKTPGKAYNPLFLYGDVGLGKTHLLQAIGQQVLEDKQGVRIAYESSEKFTNEYIDALQNNRLSEFREKYRNTDVLLIDDIQFLAGKERIQEEFFHTFNTLYETRRQIVMTCDRPASEIQNLEQRLVSRFEWGLVADLQIPDVETRTAILRKKEEDMKLKLPDEIISFLANRIRTNIRRLEGALIRVSSFASLTGKELTIEVVEGLLREILHEEGRISINIDLIQKKVAEHFDIRLADMKSKRRPESIAFPRQIAMFLSRQMTDFSLNAIGESFGGRDHGTVIHACRLVKDRMDIDENIRQVIHYLERQIMR